jgi:hypothetical protein
MASHLSQSDGPVPRISSSRSRTDDFHPARTDRATEVDEFEPARGSVDKVVELIAVECESHRNHLSNRAGDDNPFAGARVKVSVERAAARTSKSQACDLGFGWA